VATRLGISAVLATFAIIAAEVRAAWLRSGYSCEARQSNSAPAYA
jgi:hypothetical protein